jgi:hypothetical protein
MLLGTTGHAQLPQPGKTAILASLVPESAVVASGETVTLALMMRARRAGTATERIRETEASRPRSLGGFPGASRPELVQYPAPDQLIISGLINYVYAGDYTQFIEMKVPVGVAPGTK